LLDFQHFFYYEVSSIRTFSGFEKEVKNKKQQIHL